jgi:hypothetical protein
MNWARRVAYAIAKRLELANQRILARDTVVRRTRFERKASRLSMFQRGIYLIQMLHQSVPDVTRLAYKNPFAVIREAVDSRAFRRVFLN